jgi:hypothetical protein
MALTSHAVTVIEAAVESLTEIDAQIADLEAADRRLAKMNNLGIEVAVLDARKALYTAITRLVEQQNRIRATVRAMPR